ncbi:alpha-1,6-mannosyl-glycoprotein 2-beta-N-acetylglucosaminyltransferase-like isoform X2 [Drosophila novamexicana]|uniref:alpha-1,6-mannosyl-glycoprotein 2-beta-N-acetylglucosaminyltransferase-like isoform X2 n=1 Tax=Drosophila novamexicana TaxID=47314 RepID=UPI0011E5ABC0|nr:alpha-1,6-mannosyl-glycoprotein 2-beta-N-acetylglucosaminyltransferase-like isoform X2 [Drosophila novamexicana]
MLPKHIRFPIRTIFLLIIFFIILMYCSFLFRNFNVMLSKPRPSILPKLDYGYLSTSNETSERLHPNKILKIMQRIHKANKQQLILNKNKYGPLENDSVVIVIQVHKRINYLKYLVNSLSHAKDIYKVLLVFSHDVYEKEINDFVQAIDFCKVIQIFYPHSLQTHPHTFPGKDPNDCPRNITKDKALIKKCNNALYSDLYGHYREANFTQAKHHWWWKANYVFHELRATRYHTGLMLFLEEDHFVSEDFLHVLMLMQASTENLCAHCNILCLGNYLNEFTAKSYRAKAECSNFDASHNMGLAFNRTTWSLIKNCAQAFCSHDDYNYDWSLLHVSEKCLERKFTVLSIAGPRVFHIGSCGLHQKSKDCESSQLISKIKQVLHLAFHFGQLYPPRLKITESILEVKKKKPNNFQTNGGWRDPRDHQLCLSMTLPLNSEGILNSSYQSNKTGIKIV